MAPRRNAATAAVVLAGCAGCSAWVAAPAARGFTGQRVAQASATPSDTAGALARVARAVSSVMDYLKLGTVHVNRSVLSLLSCARREKDNHIQLWPSGLRPLVRVSVLAWFCLGVDLTSFWT